MRRALLLPTSLRFPSERHARAQLAFNTSAAAPGLRNSSGVVPHVRAASVCSRTTPCRAAGAVTLLLLVLLACVSHAQILGTFKAAILASPNTECSTRDICRFSFDRDVFDPAIVAAEVLAFRGGPGATDMHTQDTFIELTAARPAVIKNYLRNTAPRASQAAAFPLMLCDSFVTIDLALLTEGAQDCTTLGPGFNLNETDVSGSWFCVGTQTGQLDGRNIFLIQLTVPKGTSVGLNLMLYFNNDAQLPVSAFCGPPIAMPPLPVATTFTLTTVTTAAVTPPSTGATSASATAASTTTAPGTTTPAPASLAWVVGVVLLALAAVAGIVVVVLVLRRRNAAAVNQPVEMAGGDDMNGNVDVAEDFL